MRSGQCLGLTLLLLAAPAARAQVNVTPVEPVLPPPPDDTPRDPAPGAEVAQPARETAPPGGVVVPPPRPNPDYQSKVRGHKPSPTWTQDRNFSSTRFWVLDPGSYALETWVWSRIYPTATDGSQKPTSIRMFEEFSWGVAPHLQLDLYGEFHLDAQTDAMTGKANGARYLSYEGYRAELRIAIPNYYGQLPLNPVLYFEWMSFPRDPNRAEIRLLLGGAPTRWLFLAANPYFETNVTPSDKAFANPDGTKPTKQVYIMDAEIGTTLAAGLKVTDWLNVSLQAKIGVDMLGDDNNKTHFVFWLGPGFIVKPLPSRHAQYLKIIGTVLFLLPGSDVSGGTATANYDIPQRFEPTLIISSQL